MRRLNLFFRWTVPGLTALAVQFSADSIAQAPTSEMPEDWYKTEILIFVRDPVSAQASTTAQDPNRVPSASTAEGELWNPKPTLAYPENYRFLVNSALADQRLADSNASSSRIDEQGIQRLELPFPIEELLRDNRPDALTEPLPELMGEDPAPEPNVPPEPNMPLAETLELLAPDPNQPLLALPYQAMETEQLDFTLQARSLRRRGHRVLFHNAWWSKLDDAAETLPIAVDRSGDADSEQWPELQGSVHLYRSRFLHLEIDLWLNTLADYLPEGWQIESPPLTRESLVRVTPDGKRLVSDALKANRTDPVFEPVNAAPGSRFSNPSATEERALEAFIDTRSTVNPGPLKNDPSMPPEIAPNPTDQGPEDVERRRPYPWRHAITHRQTRRMRSGEIHYLDHPVIGVIVRIVPTGEDTTPFETNRETALGFRDRHGLEDQDLVPLAE